MSTVKQQHWITQNAGQMSAQTGDLKINVSFPNWFAKNAGYCPIHFQILPQKGVVFRDDAVVQITIGGYGGNSAGTQVEITLEKGMPEAVSDVIIYNEMSSGVQIQTRLNGRLLQGQSTYFYTGANDNDAFQNVIVVSKETPRLGRKALAALEEMATTGKWYSQLEYYEAMFHRGVYADANRLPTNWLELSSVEQLTISAPTLRLVKPDVLACLRDFVMAGGDLLVTQVESEDEMAMLLKLDLQRTLVKSEEGSKKPQRKNPVPWGYDTTSMTQPDAAEQVSMSDFEHRYNVIEGTVWDAFERETARAAFRRPSQNGYFQNYMNQPDDLIGGVLGYWRDLRACGLAYLDYSVSNTEAAISRMADAFDGFSYVDIANENRLQSPILVVKGFGLVRLEPGANRDQFLIRFHRLSQTTGIPENFKINRPKRFENGVGDDYWQWLIQSVGKTPVIPFLFFVVLFVGGVVPGIIFWCNRHQRRIWLIVAMPVAALIATLLLFAYGLVKDGTQSIYKIRSLTFLDKEGDGFAWSRQTYFVPSVPSRGLEVGAKTQLTRLTFSTSAEWRDGVHLPLPDRQLFQGWLPPRQQSQYSFAHPVLNVQPIQRDNDVDAVLQQASIVNALNVPWHVGVFFAENGKAFAAQDVAPHSKAIFTESSTDDAMAILRKQYLSAPLIAPADAPSADQLSLNEYFFEYFTYRTTHYNMTGTISEELDWQNELGTTFAGESFAKPSLPNTFILFLEKADHVERFPVTATEKPGLHTIIGHW
jgi:hypothetical protein